MKNRLFLYLAVLTLVAQRNKEIKLEGQFLKHQIRMPSMAGLYWITLRTGSEILKASIVTR